MGINNIVQLVTLVINIVLIIIVLRSGWSKIKGLFLVYLLASVGWSLTSFMGNYQGIPLDQALSWAKLVAIFASWSVVAYGYFIATFVRKYPGVVATLGYGYVLLMIALTVTGWLHQGYGVVDGRLVKDYGQGLMVLSAGNAIFVCNSFFLLIRSYRASTNPDHRNRIIYLLTGLSLLVVAGSLWAIFDNLSAADHFGHMSNALLICYAVMRFHLLDIKLVLRKGLVYTGITVFVTACCLMLTAIWSYLFHAWSPSASLALTVAIVVGMAIIFNPLRNILEKGSNRIFYGRSYDYRETLRSFSTKMNNVIDLKQLADAMVFPLTNAVRASQASLLFATNDHFVSQFAQRYEKNDPVTPILLRRDGPIIRWLEREGKLLTSDIIWREPEFKGMWEEERNVLEAAELEVLCPIISKKKLVAILALSRKHGHGYYSRDDTDLVMTLALQAAVAIENAQLYEKAKQRADTDELTGLFNHRFFHQRLDEEISRCSRFGAVFSLLFIDIDQFKTYNDVYGHLAGDDILKKVSNQIKTTVRDTDICFRYGGDELAIILPETPAEGGRKVAEKIRKGIGSRTEWLGNPITLSVGIAFWPGDGVIKEDLIQASDTALYYAKQTGKNRTCLACEVALTDVLRTGANIKDNASEAVLNTIYALAATVDAKDHYTYGHSKKVSQYATLIAEAAGYNNNEIERIRAAALLHDIGKIGISDRLLQKRESLMPSEWELIRAHPDLGVSIIKHVDSLHGCLAAVQYHHEHWDGSGYPAGLKDKNIPLDARIMAVADAFDAMTSQRPYRNRQSYARAMEEIKRCSGTQFDPEIVKVFIRIAEESKILADPNDRSPRAELVGE